MELQMDKAALDAFLAETFPQAAEFLIDRVEPMRATVRLEAADRHLRPGGTISGPSMFALADMGVYIAVLAMVGPRALAVTTNASIDFMRKPKSGCDLVAETRLLKLGRVLAVGDVLIRSEGTEAPVARASLTYSLPPER